ncbi:hypothetical protein OFP00_38435, partial [Escherichia coli]|nr:hypothetical protein [Escherichia coli]
AENENLLQICNDTVDSYFKKIAPLIDEIELPGNSSERVTKLDLVQIDELLSRVSSIHSNLTQWFNKLKTERQQALYKILI